MKKLICLILALLTVTMVFAGCGAKTSDKTDWDYIADKGEMIIGITYFAPMNYIDKETQELIGFETEFAKAVCAKLGVSPKFQEIDWNAKETELNAKNIDCIWNGMTIDDERKANMDISIPYMRNRQVMIVKKENVAKYTTAESLKDAALVAEMKSAGEKVAQNDDFFAQAKYTAVDSQAKTLVEVKAGTADIAVIDYIMALGSIGEGTDYTDLAVVGDGSLSFGEPEFYGIAFRKNSPKTLEKINAAIKELKKDGTLDTIAKKYKLQDYIVVE
ncbi:MAG: transporter substrate-binding domain-containing protein [Ruminococcaceae bacterium]|nr:transporter substrate-binding domain-containing protein [Oscillospiraceae bacterium]